MPPKVGPKLNWESSRLTEGDEKPETNQNYFTYNPMRKRQSMKKMFKFDTSIDELSDQGSQVEKLFQKVRDKISEYDISTLSAAAHGHA